MILKIRLSGFGGQGIGLAGFLLGKALSLYDGKEAVMTQSYGPEARGGASSANVVVSDEPIDYPFVDTPDILVALSQEAYTKFISGLKPGGIVLIDTGLVAPDEGSNAIGLPATKLAEELGRRIVMNVVMLGFFTAHTGVVSRDAMEQALKDTLKPKIIPLNLRAFSIGYSFEIEQPLLVENKGEVR